MFISRTHIFLIAIIVLAILVFYSQRAKAPEVIQSPTAQATQTATSTQKIESELRSPLDNARARVMKKPFGIYSDPKTSSVENDRFTGWHSGTDFEIFPGEEDKEVLVRAICFGRVLQYRTGVSGYGGVVVQECKINNQPVTVVYGHVKRNTGLASMPKAGEIIAVLGKGFSSETDGERKHLHMGIHRGTDIVIAGYVSTQSQLAAWIDSLSILP